MTSPAPTAFAQYPVQALMHVATRPPAMFTHGQGSWLHDSEGRRYLDLVQGWAVNSLGHAPAVIAQALAAQSARLLQAGPGFYNDRAVALAERLAALSGLERSFFTSSGAEANEGAIKLARKFGQVHRGGAFEIITFESAFHGRTLATIAAGGQKKYLEGFGPKVEGFDQVPFGDLEATRKAITPETAAILIEPLQGEGGIRDLPPGGLAALRQLCDEHGLLLVLDEVQCGIGRMGKLFAYQWTDVEPDLMAIAKGIGGGFPVGACLATNAAAAGMTPGTHGTTFGGNPLAMAVGNAVLDVVLANGFLDEVKRKGLFLKQSLAAVVDEFPQVFEDVRGSGLMAGIKCRMVNSDVNAGIRAEHLLLAPAGDNVLRLLPPLTVSDDEIRQATDRIRGAASKLAAAAKNAA